MNRTSFVAMVTVLLSMGCDAPGDAQKPGRGEQIAVKPAPSDEVATREKVAKPVPAPDDDIVTTTATLERGHAGIRMLQTRRNRRTGVETVREISPESADALSAGTQNELHPTGVSAVRSALTQTNFIQNVTIIAGSKKTIECPAGFRKFPVDLNAGAGGKYIYLCLTNAAELVNPHGLISGLDVYNSSSGSTFEHGARAGNGIDIFFRGNPTLETTGADLEYTRPTGCTGCPFTPANTRFFAPVGLESNGDLNQGASGDWIYLATTHGGQGLVGVSITASWQSATPCPSGTGWQWITTTINGFDADLNEEAGGQYLYLCVQR